jgi:glycine betaine/proline transport system substrate-binding protein
MSRLLKVCISTCALALISGAVSAQDGASKVRLGQIDLSFYAVTGAVVHEVLDRLGHDVEVVEGLHADIFPKLGKGEIDLLAAAWLPNGHGDYWRKYGDNATELATLYENAKIYWALPAYVPEGKVESVQDLIKEGVKDRMKKEIRGIGEDSGLMKRSQTMLP